MTPEQLQTRLNLLINRYEQPSNLQDTADFHVTLYRHRLKGKSVPAHASGTSSVKRVIADEAIDFSGGPF